LKEKVVSIKRGTLTNLLRQYSLNSEIPLVRKERKSHEKKKKEGEIADTVEKYGLGNFLPY